MKAGLKIAVAAGVVATAAAVLTVLYAGARHRALVSYCRNNLRHLGGLATRNWENLEPSKTGRLFWQEVREAQYHAPNGKWSVPPAEPFTCPVVHEGVHPDAGDPATIDYLGPRTVREKARLTPKGEAIGADRPGNHPSGGLVLRIDTSVDDLPAILTEAKGADWEEATKVLKD